MKSFKQILRESLIKLSNALGSNEGGIYSDSEGNKVYKKIYKNGDQAKVEELTSKIYNELGIKTQNPKYSNESGNHQITTKWDDTIRPSKPSDYNKISKEQAHQLAKMYHGAILTKNWDIVGLDHDNIMKNIHNDTFSSIDHGGSFHFRAQGGPKHYDTDINELHTLLHNNNASGYVFSQVNKQHPTAFKDTISSVKQLNMDKLHDHFKASGLNNWKELYNNFKEKKYKLEKHYDDK